MPSYGPRLLGTTLVRGGVQPKTTTDYGSGVPSTGDPSADLLIDSGINAAIPSGVDQAVSDGEKAAAAAAALTGVVIEGAILVLGQGVATALVSVLATIGITAAAGSVVPLVGTIVGAVAGVCVGIISLLKPHSRPGPSNQEWGGLIDLLVVGTADQKRSMALQYGDAIVNAAAKAVFARKDWQTVWPGIYLHLAEGERNDARWLAYGRPGSFKDALATVVDVQYAPWLAAQPNAIFALGALKAHCPAMVDDLKTRYPFAQANAILVAMKQALVASAPGTAAASLLMGGGNPARVDPNVYWPAETAAKVAAASDPLVAKLVSDVLVYGDMPRGLAGLGMIAASITAKRESKVSISAPRASGVRPPNTTNVLGPNYAGPKGSGGWGPSGSLSSFVAGFGAGGIMGGNPFAVGVGGVPVTVQQATEIGAVALVASGGMQANAGTTIAQAQAGNDAAKQIILNAVSAGRAPGAPPAAKLWAASLTAQQKLAIQGKYVARYFGPKIAQVLMLGHNLSLDHVMGK